jgi:pimeloyl-ACP methyl ester carboxylesterase
LANQKDWVRERYAIRSDPRQAVIGGVSAGGLMAAFAALRHPEVLGNVLSQSGAFWWLPGFDENKLAPEGIEQNCRGLSLKQSSPFRGRKGLEQVKEKGEIEFYRKRYPTATLIVLGR